MDQKVDLLTFLDLLDLDEELIDDRLKSLMARKEYSNKHLTNVILLLQYKTLINTQEGTECENNDELDFVVKLIKDLDMDKVYYISKIVNYVLCLKTSSLVSNAEHLLQQILLNIDLQTEKSITTQEKNVDSESLVYLKLCDSILDAVITNGEKVYLAFLDTPLENILDKPDKKLQSHFLSNSVPRLFNGLAVGYNILDRIWEYIKSKDPDQLESVLKILCCLSDFYLPLPMSGGDKFVSEIIFQNNFWHILLLGMNSDDPAIRKLSVYLSKRAIDCVIATNKDIKIKSDDYKIFTWTKKESETLKMMWHNFFILIDSLVEKQSNIVLPSLHLFGVNNIEDVWMKAAFKIGMKHDNMQVRLKCLEHRFKHKIKITDNIEAILILEALNDINIYDQNIDSKILLKKMAEFLKDEQSFTEILKAISLIKWSPVPLFHITNMLAESQFNIKTDITEIVIDILKVSCNNIVIRKAVHINISKFIKNCCPCIEMKDIIRIIPVLDVKYDAKCLEHPFYSLIEKHIENDERLYCLENMLGNCLNLDFLLVFLKYHNDDNIFINILKNNINKLQEVIKTVDSDKSEHLEFVILLINLFNKTKNEGGSLQSIHKYIAKQTKTLLQYILALYSSALLNIEQMIKLLKIRHFDAIAEESEIYVIQLYSTSISQLNEQNSLENQVLSLFVIRLLLNDHYNNILSVKNKVEFINLKEYLEVITSSKYRNRKNVSIGRLNNIFNEMSCEVLYRLILQHGVEDYLQDVILYIENALECGGYGCLEWILKIVNKIPKHLVDCNKFSVVQFLNRVWKEIEELKSNSQYNVCMRLFIDLIVNETLLDNVEYNNIIIFYYSKIIDLGLVKNYPMYILATQLQSCHIVKYSHLIYVICDMLLYCPVPRKDERITENVTSYILQKPEYLMARSSFEVPFTYKIQYLSASILCGINNELTLNIIREFITNKIDITFKNKQRYHGNSQLHRMLQTSLQHLLMMILNGRGELDGLVDWCFGLLVKLPHQPSVRVCFEWIISLYYYIQKINLGEEMLLTLQSKNVPLTSQFFIFNWLLKHKIINNTYTEDEYNFVLDFLLSHTMGQLFNIRLNAQYLATSLHKLQNKPTKFDYAINIIEKTFLESCSDKNYVKLQADFFANEFDIVRDLTPYFVYSLLPRYCDRNCNETFVLDYVVTLTQSMIERVKENSSNDEFRKEWQHVYDDSFVDVDVRSENVKEIKEDDIMQEGSIQKKYIPWKNMGLEYDVEKKQQSSSELIVVASLIDKLPNLGGMARTSEVFGVKTYVVDSLRHLQDKQFQSLSVSAERWIDVEEVRPGQALKQYLLQKKRDGYCVVAAEQTSGSRALQTFQFPQKTVLLLGHEKDGVPCDLLPLMDHCVEIPQRGFVRSLNVHVTAALCVWEYARQHLL